MTFVSHAQNFEDVLLWRALKDVEHGRYLDIGAQDPVVDSISLSFYELGWRGTHVEPSPAYAAKLREARPDETVIEAAVTDAEGPIDFFEIAGTGLSTGIAEIAEHHCAAGFTKRRLSVPCVKLSHLLAQEAGELHWMKIDVEGMEADVLRSWGRSKARPWVLIIESTYPCEQTPTERKWIGEVLKRGYTEVFFDGLSRYFLHEAQLHRSAAFEAPANIFDCFAITIDHVCAVLIRQQLGEATDLAANLDTASVDMRSQIAALDQRIEALDRQIEERDHQIEALDQQIEARDQQIEALNEQLASAEDVAQAERQKAEAERERTEAERQRAEFEREKAEAERKTAATERDRAEAERQKAAAAAEARDLARQQQVELARELARASEAHCQAILDQSRESEAVRQALADSYEKAADDLRQELRQSKERESAARADVARVEARVSELEASGEQLRTEVEQGRSALNDSLILLACADALICDARSARVDRWQRLGEALGLSRRGPEQLALDGWSSEASRGIVTPYPVNQMMLREAAAQMTDKNPYLRAPSLAELLAWHDVDFVRCAYVTMLGRQPDPDGEAYYTSRIRSGHSKMEVLWQLRKSEEGPKHDPGIAGLDKALKRARRARRPISGWFLRTFGGVEGDSTVERRMRALETKLAVDRQLQRQLIAEIDQRLNELTKELANVAGQYISRDETVVDPFQVGTAEDETAPLPPTAGQISKIGTIRPVASILLAKIRSRSAREVTCA